MNPIPLGPPAPRLCFPQGPIPTGSIHAQKSIYRKSVHQIMNSSDLNSSILGGVDMNEASSQCVFSLPSGVSSGKCPSPLKNRDFVTMRSWLPLGNDYLIINYSVKHPVRLFPSSSRLNILTNRGKHLGSACCTYFLFAQALHLLSIIFLLLLYLLGKQWPAVAVSTEKAFVHSGGKPRADTDRWLQE